jgi:hypothetical protein
MNGLGCTPNMSGSQTLACTLRTLRRNTKNCKGTGSTIGTLTLPCTLSSAGCCVQNSPTLKVHPHGAPVARHRQPHLHVGRILPSVCSHHGQWDLSPLQRHAEQVDWPQGAISPQSWKGSACCSRDTHEHCALGPTTCITTAPVLNSYRERPELCKPNHGGY